MIFNPEAPKEQSPDQTGQSRGIGTSHVFSTLFGGAANMAEGWIKYRDEQIQENIYNDTVSQTDQIAQDYIDVLHPGQMSENGDAVGAAGGSTARGPAASSPGGGARAAAGDVTQLPPGLQQDASGISRLQSAYESGTIRQAYYDNQLLAMSKGLHQKYPGYERQVDAIVSQVTGKNPRNALMGDFYEEARANAANASDASKAWNSFVNQNLDDIRVADPTFFQHPGDYEANPALQWRLKQSVATVQAEDKNVQRETARLNLKAAQGADVSLDAYTTGLDHANFLANSLISTTLDSSGDFMSRLQKSLTDPSVIDPAEVQGLVQNAAQILTMQKARVNQYIASNGLEAMIHDPQKLEAIRQAAVQPIMDIMDALNNKDYGLAYMNALASKNMQDATTRQILQDHPMAQVVQSLKQIGGDQAVNAAISGDAGFAGQYHDMLSSFGTLNAAAGTITSANDFANYVKPGVKSGKVGGSVIPQNIQDVVNHLMDPKVNDAVATNYIQYLYGGDNMDFLQNFGSGDKGNTLAQQTQIYSQLVNPAVSDRIHNLSSKNPELWNNYVKWAATNFTSLFKQTGDEVQKAIVNRPYMQIHWNAETSQFTVDLNREMPNGLFGRGLFSMNPMDIGEPGLTLVAKKNISLMNAQLANVRKIAELSHLDPNEEIMILLHSMGVDPGAPKEGNFWDQMFHGIARAVMPSNDGQSDGR